MFHINGKISEITYLILHTNWLNRFLQGPETDPETVKKIREAIDNQTEVTVQLINYTRTGISYRKNKSLS
jgi:hypothetical protein